MTILERVAGAVAHLRRSGSETKSWAGGTVPVVAFHGHAPASWGPRTYGAFARDGFMRNPIVYRSVRMIAEAAASVPLLVRVAGERQDAHPLAELLSAQHAGLCTCDLMEEWYGALLVAGNAFLEVATAGGEPRELRTLRPDRVTVQTDRDGWVDGYVYDVGGRRTILRDDPSTAVRRVLHLRLYHPLDDHMGLSPIEAAATAIDIHNEASRWNKALLDNAARPSGALVYQAAGGHLNEEQYGRLKAELEAGFQGAANAGRPLLLEGGLDWKAMALSPRDMDFIEAKNAAAREIALALGVPPMLLGIPGDNTYANYQEANRTFWRQTVLPLVKRTGNAVAAWLSPAWPERLTLEPDLEGLPALAAEREADWARLEKTSFLTVDEKRAVVGYAPLADDPAQSLVEENGFAGGEA